MFCPRCQRENPDHFEECPGCGVIFSQFRPRPERPVPSAPLEVEEPIWRAGLGWLGERMFEVEPAENQDFVVFRAILLGILGLWWLRLLFVPAHGEALGGSIMHLINLPFHEAGHFVFQPFGRFLHILGGTLGQLLVPFIVICAFLREGDPFGASVGLWWLGQSFMDCAPYIHDSREGVLMLTTGETGSENWEGHDWRNILQSTGLLRWDHSIARAFWILGVLLMLAALAWGVHVLRRQYRKAPRPV